MLVIKKKMLRQKINNKFDTMYMHVIVIFLGN